MAELSYPTSGGGSVVDTRYEALIGSATPSCVYGVADNSALVYGDSSGRQVKVRASRAAMVRGYRWESDGAGITRAIAANSSGSPRVDLAVLRLNRSDWTVTFQVITGTPASSPVPPSYTQTEGSTGVWELPVASIAVANGASTISAANVIDRAPTLGGWIYEGNQNYPPAIGAGSNPQLFYANDSQRLYSQIAGSYSVIGENGSLVTVAAATGWSGSVFVRRWNGLCWFQGLVTRTGATLTSNTPSDLFTIPAGYLPPTDCFMVGYAGGVAMRTYMNSSSGLMSLNAYTINFGTGAALAIHPATWPTSS